MGMGEAFHDPASHALLANVMPADAFENAASWSNGFGQLASMVGPALGGVVIATFGGRLPPTCSTLWQWRCVSC